MVTNKSLRSYEVSIWTLQDSFITVLKPSNLEYQGQITEPNMVLKDDGENKFSFKIPMYIKDNNGDLIENPIWYNTINGNIIANLRKIKVIFNKKQEFEEVFEFIIINVEELHEGNKKICSIECEGLAFHELGKQGYKISLSGQDDINAAQEAWLQEENPTTSCPKANINYWADKIFKGTNWRYSVQMDWSASDGVSHEVYTINEIDYDSDNYENFSEDIKNKFNILRAQKGLKRRDIIYQEEYVSSWQSSDDQTNLIPSAIQAEREKHQLMEAKESNRYNLSQTLAELFQVFCKYKYYYDDNYHIIDREVIFYNNFLNESNGVIDFTYKYNTNNLSRKMESSDLVTKMFVPSIKDEYTEIGECSIMDTAANKSGEDYLLNFDYMYNIGTINKEQYDEIEPYQTKLHDINKNYNEIQEELSNKNNKLEQELNPKLQNAKDMCTVATERIGDANSSISAIDEISERTSSAPAHLILKHNSDLENIYYCNFNDNGIMIETLKLYNTYDSMRHTLSNEILSYNLEYDDYQNLTGISGLIKINNSQTSIYAVYQFKPNLYYNNIIETYGTVLAQNTNIINTVSNEITTLKNEIENLEQNKKDLLKQKEEIISKFENFMGPALREGKWQPEDEYSGYGDLHENELYSINMNSQLNEEILTSFGWDSELFDEEQKCYYEFGVELKKYYYPCIKITSELITTVGNGTVYDFINNSSFIYNSSVTGSNIHKYMTIGSKMIFCFLRKNNEEVIPVLMLIGAKEAANNEIESITNGKIGIIEFENTIIESNIYGDIEWVISPNACQTPIDGEPEYKVVFPRFFINSTTVKSPETMIGIKQENTLLEIYEDFYILERHFKPYITIKPEVFLRNGLKDNYSYSITYTISTAALAIYLDAIKVLQENSCPKASYEINISSIDEKFTQNAYQRLGQIAHINDYEFKFENVMGYISELNLNLDKPWEDKVIIKNYKTKFEDLFSTIVAQTEQMKKNSAVLSTAITYFGTNGSGGLINELYEDLNNKVEELISPNITTLLRQYSDYEPFVNAKLQQVFNEASKILNASQNALEEVNNLNIENSDILNLFKYNVKESMTGTLFEDNNSTQQYRENKKLNAVSFYFKKGDIWHHDGKYYVAIMSSDQVDYGNMSEEQRLTSLKGWNLTSDDSLAQIKGAKLDINTDTGEISLRANDIEINGGEKVNISGPELYLISNNVNENSINAGIHMMATELKDNAETQFSTIDITSSGIIMKAEDGIKFQSGGGIEFSVSNGNNSTSVMRINSENGIYLGSDKSIKFYSGSADGAGTGNGTSVEINKDKLLFGVSNGANQSAVKLTANDIIFGVGSIVNSNSVGDIGTSKSGIKINRESIKMAVAGENNFVSYLNISGEDITISNTNKSNGAFVSINQAGVFIGAGLNSSDGINETTRNNMIESITEDTANSYSGACFQVYTPNFIVTNEGKLYTRNAYLAGEIQSGKGNIGGWYIGSYYLGNTNNQDSSTVGIASKHTNGNSATYSFWAGGAYNSTPSFSVTPNGYLRATSVRIGAQNSASYLTYDSQNGLIVNGNITATSGTIGGCVINNSGLRVDSAHIDSVNASAIVAGNINVNLNLTAGGSITGGSITGTTINNGNRTFYVDSNGSLTASNANITGTVTATSGVIGGCSIDANGNLQITNANISGQLTIGQVDGAINRDTAVSIANGQISAATINCNQLSGGIINGQNINGGTITIGSGFSVRSDGHMICNGAEINGSGSFSGSINATSGGIAGWNFNENGIWHWENDILTGMFTQNFDSDKVPLEKRAFMAGNGAFAVTYGGYLYAQNAYISGIVNANSGDLGTLNINGILTMSSNGAIKYGNKTSVGDDSNDGFYLNGSGYSFKTKDNNNRHIRMDINKNMFRILLNRNDNLGIGSILLGREAPNTNEEVHMSLYCGNYIDISSERISIISSSLNLKTTVNGPYYRFCIYTGGLSNLALPNTASSVIVIRPNDGERQEKTKTVTNADGSTTTVHDYYYRTCTVYEKW